MSKVELIGISHAYKGKQALQNLSVRFEEKKITTIIGRSGSGKSTLLQIINGLIKPSTGKAIIDGNPLVNSRMEEARWKMGYAVQGVGLFPHLTIYENISLPGKMVNQPTVLREKRVGELMELLSLSSSYRKKYPYELSGGEQQRVGIGRALFLDPPLLLMDEPFGSLDPLTRYDMQQEVLKLQSITPRTILLVTHDMREASKLADFILVLDKGMVIQFDKKESVLENPANDTVKQLIEASLS
jgi:osmoprotectant transport system ATP-binding protein